MDIGSLLLALALILLVAAFIARPLVEQTANHTGRTSTDDDLIASRESILLELRDLDFDHSTGKVSDDDYQTQRARLMAKGAEILRALDQLPTSPQRAAGRVTNIAPPRSGGSNQSTTFDDELEQLIAARRKRPAPGPATGGCPECQRAVKPNDKFCPHCGAKLPLAEVAR